LTKILNAIKLKIRRRWENRKTINS